MIVSPYYHFTMAITIYNIMIRLALVAPVAGRIRARASAPEYQNLSHTPQLVFWFSDKADVQVEVKAGGDRL